jgi:hypothetical protein
MIRQKAGIPKARCEVRLPLDLDKKVEKIALSSGVTKTAVMIAAAERLVYGEETATGVDALHERMAGLVIAVEDLQSNMLEVRSYLDALAQKLCTGRNDAERAAEFDRFLAGVEKVKAELMMESTQ